ncbi:MAG: hypothetical protein CFE21_16960 [Bacteroidetes bacterium B1(2017)]|nr:MAG: hypothetical protein CFE21_16960 [Bacteroidetes bacterium B1(2017)]
MALLLLDGCKLKNPTEGFAISIKADAVTAPSELLVRDAKTGSPLAGLTSASPVTISGPGAPYVYSSGATKALSIFQGAVSFSLRKGTPVSASNPIKFTVHINVNGYLPIDYPIELTSLEPILAETYLVSLTDLPANAAKSVKTIGTGTDGKTTDTSSIFIPSSSSKPEALKISIDAGTKMLDEQGQPVVGSVEANVFQFNSGSQEALKSFPTSFRFEDLKDANGNSIPGGGFEPAGWVDITMNAGGKSVKTFDKPLNANLEINKDQINPKTNAKFKAGDEIDVFSKSVGVSNWVKEGVATVILNSSTGNLEANIQITHLSVWGIGLLMPKCGTPLSFSWLLNKGYGSSNGTIIIRHSKTFEDVVIRASYVESRDGAGVKTVVTSFVPVADAEYLVILGGTFIAYKGKLCGSLIDLGSVPSSPSITNNIFLKCTNGSSVLLPNDYKVYYVNENDYQSTINPATKRKIDPRDPIINGKDWKDCAIQNVTIDGKTINTITLPKSDMVVGQKYRFSVYYNDGKKESREDYVTPAPIVQEVLDAGGQDVIIILAECPL